MSSISAFGHCYIDQANQTIVLNWHQSFQPNNLESTFGFHTAHTYPERNRTMLGSIDPEDQKSDEERIQAYKNKRFAMQLKKSKEGATALNILNTVGYIPVLGLIPCSLRLIEPLMNNKHSMWYEPLEVRTSHFIRGGAEGIGVGILYLIPDLIVTVKRFCK